MDVSIDVLLQSWFHAKTNTRHFSPQNTSLFFVPEINTQHVKLNYSHVLRRISFADIFHNPVIEKKWTLECAVRSREFFPEINLRLKLCGYLFISVMYERTCRRLRCRCVNTFPLTGYWVKCIKRARECFTLLSYARLSELRFRQTTISFKISDLQYLDCCASC